MSKLETLIELNNLKDKLKHQEYYGSIKELLDPFKTLSYQTSAKIENNRISYEALTDAGSGFADATNAWPFEEPLQITDDGKNFICGFFSLTFSKRL